MPIPTRAELLIRASNAPEQDVAVQACADLLVALNRLPGITANEASHYHGRQPMLAWYQVDHSNLRGQLLMARLTCNRYWSYAVPVRVELYHSDVIPTMISYMLVFEGLGMPAYHAAIQMAERIMQHVNDDPSLAYNILARADDWLPPEGE